MSTTSPSEHLTPLTAQADFFERIWEKALTPIKTFVDVTKEPALILDKDLRVIAANSPFYQTFQVKPEDTEKKAVYKLGNGQWDIPLLRNLLEDILPKKSFFKGFEVTHKFPLIGRKVMMLNARQIHVETPTPSATPHIILLAMEDVTEMMSVAELLAKHTNEFQSNLTGRTEKLENQLETLAKEMLSLENKS